MSETPPRYGATGLDWSDVEESAGNLFRVWAMGRELEWAKAAWHSMGERGLTAYTNEIDRTLVVVRLVTLAVIYRQWCVLAREEMFSMDEVSSLAIMDAEICPFRLAQFMGPEFRADDPNCGQDELVEDALLTLIDRERPTICRALIEGFGGEVKLCNALASTTNRDSYEDSESAEEDDEAAGKVLGWILEGMPDL